MLMAKIKFLSMSVAVVKQGSLSPTHELFPREYLMQSISQ
ncbi:UNVERIFIED_CONTAM: hypothetical protein GTU68_063914 [Idotea baltica]|nr:hypothetical protein [Idotea baltica]